MSTTPPSRPRSPRPSPSPSPPRSAPAPRRPRSSAPPARLARNVERVRVLPQHMEELFSGMIKVFPDERRRELGVQLGYYARPRRIIPGPLPRLYVSLGIFVAASVS